MGLPSSAFWTTMQHEPTYKQEDDAKVGSHEEHGQGRPGEVGGQWSAALLFPVGLCSLKAGAPTLLGRKNKSVCS